MVDEFDDEIKPNIEDQIAKAKEELEAGLIK